MSSTIGISLIICTYDHAELMEKCLDSLSAQTLKTPVYEVIVIDSSPNDDTKVLVNKYVNRLPAIRYFFEGRKGHSIARNRGCLEAKGDYLVYLDDDATVPVDYMENVVRVISEYSPDIMGGPVYPTYTAPKPWWFRDEFEIRKYADKSGFSTKHGISGGNFIIRKPLLESLGLFDPGYGMSAGKLGMLDDRKVLETYRYRTPPEMQKVYYSLECYINHHTPADKMRLSYMLWRSFAIGEAQFQMYLDITGQPNYTKAGTFFAKSIWDMIYQLPRDAIKNGFIQRKKYIRFYIMYIYQLIQISKGMGYLRAQLRFLLQKAIASRKRSAPRDLTEIVDDYKHEQN